MSIQILCCKSEAYCRLAEGGKVHSQKRLEGLLPFWESHHVFSPVGVRTANNINSDLRRVLPRARGKMRSILLLCFVRNRDNLQWILRLHS